MTARSSGERTQVQRVPPPAVARRVAPPSGAAPKSLTIVRSGGGPSQPALLVAVTLALAPSRALAADPPPPPAVPAPDAGDASQAKDDAAERKAAARARFDKGKALSGEGAWGAALAEFLASRELYPTWGNTLGAASSFRKLARFDEALDMFEILLRDFSAALSAEVRTAAQREVVELRGLVGTIEVEGAELGAAITIDGRARGEHPSPSPLRVGAGTHVVRVSKEGFETFEARADVAGNRTVQIVAKMRPLVASGRLRIAEEGGAALDVIVDGVRAGVTPWEGTLSPGDHVVLLRGEGDLGTPPVPVTVTKDATARLTLRAERLTARVRVEPQPASASIAIDAVTVGQGTWEGALRPGAHKIEVAAPGFVAAARDVSLAEGERAVVPIVLQRDPSSPFWRKPPPPSRFLAEVAGSVPILPGLGGDIESACAAGCSAGPGIGAYVAVRAGYELPSGFGFGLAAGFLLAEQSIQGRPASIQPVGLSGQAEGVLDHTLAIRRGLLVGPWVGFSIGDRFPVHLRVAAGPLFAWVGDTRTGTFTPVREGPTYPVGPLSVSAFAPFVHVTPDVRVGYRVTPRFEVSLGLDALVLIALDEPAWDADRPINAGADGIGTFPADRFVGRVLFGIAPGLGARYDFL